MTLFLRLAIPAFLLISCGQQAARRQESTAQDKKPPDSVRAKVQIRPGGPVEEVEMKVHEVPVDLPTVSAEEASLEDGDLVLGVVVDGSPVAYPIRYLAQHEVVNDSVGGDGLAPTW